MTPAQRLLVPLPLVAAVTAVGVALDAGTTPAALVLLAVVVASALLGRGPGLVGAVSSMVALHVWFTPALALWEFDQRDELVAVVTYVAVALVVGNLVARTADLRRRAEQGEVEARTRLDLKRRLLAGEPVEEVVRSAATALVGLFGMASCRLSIGDVTVRVHGSGRPGRSERLAAGNAEVEVVQGAGHGLSDGDRAVIEALAAGLAAAVALVRVAAEAERAREVAETGRMRARVLSAVSHNLRTPLAAIRAAAEVMQDRGEELAAGQRADLLATVREEAMRLERLVANALDLGRIRAGGLVPDRRPVDPGDLVRAAVRRVEPLAADHPVEVAIDDPLPLLQVDIAMMEQVLGNLLENALRFAPAGSPIVVDARRCDGAVEMRVVDSGPGVPPGDRERVFEPFIRGAGEHEEASGVGLGLAIVRSLVHLHGGGVWYEETGGGGATFALRVPVGRSS